MILFGGQIPSIFNLKLGSCRPSLGLRSPILIKILLTWEHSRHPPRLIFDRSPTVLDPEKVQLLRLVEVDLRDPTIIVPSSKPCKPCPKSPLNMFCYCQCRSRHALKNDKALSHLCWFFGHIKAWKGDCLNVADESCVAKSLSRDLGTWELSLEIYNLIRLNQEMGKSLDLIDMRPALEAKSDQS